MKKAIAIILSIMIVLAITLPAAAVSTIALKSISLNNSKITLKVSQTSNLKVTFTPANTSQKKLIYVTSNKNIVTVNSDGLIVGVHGGTATITVYTLNKAIFEKCSVTVLGIGNNKPVKISLWSGYPELDSWFTKMAKEYRATNPNVSIEIASFPLRDFEKKATTSLPSKSCADIISINPNLAMRFAKEDMLLKAPDDLSKFVSGGAYDPAIVNNVKNEGIVYGVPHMYGTAALYCNSKMFKEAGLTGAPKTMDQLMEYAKKLTKYDANGKVIRSGLSLRKTGGGSGLAEKFWILMMQNGGSLVEEVSPEKYKAGYNNEAGLKTFQMYIDMLHKYHTDDFDVLSDAAGFEAEKTAMFARETWVIADIKKNAPQLEYFTAPMPNSNIGIAEDFFVSNSGDDKKVEAAWDFIRFMMKPENHKQMTAMSGWQTGRLDMNMEDFLGINPQYRAYFTKYNKINTIPMIDEFDEIETKLADRLTNKGYTDKSFVGNPEKMKAFLNDCAAETNQILKENGHLAQ